VDKKTGFVSNAVERSLGFSCSRIPPRIVVDDYVSAWLSSEFRPVPQLLEEMREKDRTSASLKYSERKSF
jgi:hypothetical protein